MRLTGTSSSKRLRERLLQGGASHLSDGELLGLLLGGGSATRPANELAYNLLDRCGSLTATLGASAKELAALRGLGPARIARLQAAVELGRRYLTEPLARGSALTAPSDAAKFFQAHLSDRSHEVFGCLFLDTRHRIICYEELFRGTAPRSR